MLAYIRKHSKSTSQQNDIIEYVQGSPAMIGHKVGDILLTVDDRFSGGLPWETVTVHVLPEPEQL